MSWLQILLAITGLPSQPQAAPPASADGTVVFARGQVKAVRSWTMGSDLGIQAVDSSGNTLQLKADDVMVLDQDVGMATVRRARVLLRNGETLNADLVTGSTGGRLTFQSLLWGRLELDATRVTRYEAEPSAPAGDHPGSPGQDSRPMPPFVLLQNGDLVAAGIDRIDAGEVSVNTEFGQTQIPLHQVSAVVLTVDNPLTDGRGPRQFLVELADGQRFYCDAVSEVEGRIALTRAGHSCSVNREAIRRIIWPNATVGLLADTSFRGEGSTYFGKPALPRQGCNALGGPLRLGERWFASGVGMRPKSRCVFQLNDRWAYVAGHVGLDPSLGQRGQCEIAVRLAGKEAYKDRLQSNRPTRRFMLPVPGAGDIEFQVDFGPGGDLGDYVNWCDLVLVGERSLVQAPAKGGEVDKP